MGVTHAETGPPARPGRAESEGGWWDLHQRGENHTYRHVMSAYHDMTYVGMWRDTDKDGRRLDAIYLYHAGPPTGDKKVNGAYPVPGWMCEAFEAGEPIEPLLDYLLEAHGAARPELEWAVAEFTRVHPRQGEEA